MRRTTVGAVFFAAAALFAPGGVRGAEAVEEPLRRLVEEDWALQEGRRGRDLADPAAVTDALARGSALLAARKRGQPATDFSAATKGLAALADRAATVDAEARARLYCEIRWFVRDLALANPLIAGTPIAFLQRRRFICQMLHEYLGYYYDYGDIAGGGVFVLERPGFSAAVRDLVQGRLPRGNVTTLALSYDAKTLYFGFAPRAPEKPDYYSPERRCFHIHAVGADGSGLRRLTDGPDDDFDPCPLPDGGIAFMSTRRGGFGRCHNHWEPLPSYTLHRMEADGRGVRTLSFHETNEWHPSVLADGRIVYARWDYVDRSAANYHGLWVSNPDGTNPMGLFGNYTETINACFQPRAIPDSRRIVFVAGAHHAAVGGSLVVVDPAAVGLDPKSGEDSFDAIEVLTPDVCFPEAPGWPRSYFHSPWPLSEDYFLTAFSFDPLSGMGPGVKEDTTTGLYLFDRFGNLELLYRAPGISCMYPIPLAPRPIPPALASTLDPALGDEGEFLLADVRRSHFPLPEGRPILALGIFQVLPKSETHVANRPRLGYANAESARMFLGTVPVEQDGSAYFRAPARKPLYFHALDAAGRAVQGMRSVTYLQPGERRSCVGCHEPRGSAPSASPPFAARRAPSTIAPGPDGTRPWSFPRLLQPILDARCVRCHDGLAGPGKHAPALAGAQAGEFSQSYASLKPHVAWYEWGQGIGGLATRPGRMPSDVSPLVAILNDATHREGAGLTGDELRRIFLWLDGNASFYGTYAAAAQRAQRDGEAVPVPTMQ